MAYTGKRDGVGRIWEWIHNLEDGKVLEVTFEAESSFGFCKD